MSALAQPRGAHIFGSGCQLFDDVAQPVRLLLARDVAGDTARVLDVFLPVQHLPDRAGLRPAGFHRWTAKISEFFRGLSSKMASVGVLDRIPPSQ